MGRAIFHPDTFALQIVKGFELAFFGNHQRRVSIVSIGKGNLFATLRSDIHTGDNRVVFLKFQRRDQAIERMVGERTFSLHLLTERVSEIDIKADNLVVGIHGFKRRVGGGNAKANFICGLGACGDGGK